MARKPLGANFDIVPAIVPVNLATAANDGDWVSLRDAAGVAIVVFKGAGTAGEDPDISVEQASDVAGTGAKALNAITEVYKKQGAALTSVGVWTKVTQAADDLFDADATSAEEQAVYVIQIDAAQLDVDGGFDCVRAKIADVGAASQIGGALYLLYGLSYPSAPEDLPSAIVD